MSAESLAREHYDGRRSLTEAVSRLAAQLWQRLDPANLDASWARLGPQLMLGVTGAQLAAARAATGYVDGELEEQGAGAAPYLRVNPSALAGIASDGRPLDSLLYNAITTVKASLASGATLERAMAAGLANADMIARTQVADAGRIADGVALAAHPKAHGYRRMLVGKSCSRCVVLAGRWYEWNAGFLRHPRCDCVHVPAAESLDDVTTNPKTYFASLTPAEQDKAFTIAGARAIRDGADIGQVVNARRGAHGIEIAGARITDEEARILRGGGERGRLASQRIFGQDLFVTSEGTTVRGTAGRRLGARETGTRRPGARYRSARAPRLMPESIYKIAGNDREEALRLLRRNGYLTDAPKAARPVSAKPAAPVVPATPARPVRALIKGRDRLADEAGQLNATPGGLAALRDRLSGGKFDSILSDIGGRQGFDGLPRVVSAAELDSAIADGWTEVWRGVTGSPVASAAQINGRFRAGAYEPGRGQYGNGFYTSPRRLTAENYRGREPRTNFPAGGGGDFELSDLDGSIADDSMLRLGLDPDARVIDYDELTTVRDEWLAAQPPGGPANAALSDPGRFAASLGYDAIRVGGRHGDGGYYPGWEDMDDEGGAVQWIVLNRTAVMVQRVEDVP